MHPNRILALSIAILTFVTALPADAANGRRNNNNNRNRQPRTVKVDATVSEYTIDTVGKNSITIRNEKEKRVFSITDDTQVFIARLTASVARLKKGMKVTVQPSLLDPTAARTISVEDNAIPVTKGDETEVGEERDKNKNSRGENKPSGNTQRKGTSGGKKK